MRLCYFDFTPNIIDRINDFIRIPLVIDSFHLISSSEIRIVQLQNYIIILQRS